MLQFRGLQSELFEAAYTPHLLSLWSHILAISSYSFPPMDLILPLISCRISYVDDPAIHCSTVAKVGAPSCCRALSVFEGLKINYLKQMPCYFQEIFNLSTRWLIKEDLLSRWNVSNKYWLILPKSNWVWKGGGWAGSFWNVPSWVLGVASAEISGHGRRCDSCHLGVSRFSGVQLLYGLPNVRARRAFT